jgi:hypothetical protein
MERVEQKREVTGEKGGERLRRDGHVILPGRGVEQMIYRMLRGFAKAMPE